MLEEFHDAQFPIVAVPFFGTIVHVQLRELTQAQIYAAGGIDLSLIETFQDKIRMKKKPSMQECVEYSSVQHNIAKKALYKPTYQEIIDTIKGDIDIEATRAEIHMLHEKLAVMPDSKEAEILDNDISRLEIRANLLLPDDFLGAVVAYALGISKSDIKEVTEESLYRAATEAKLGNDNPSDHIDGRFTAFNRDDINRRAWIIYMNKQKEIADGN